MTPTQSKPTEWQLVALAQFREAFHLGLDIEFIPVSPQLLDSIEQEDMDRRALLVGVQRTPNYPFVDLILENREANPS